MHKKTLFPLIIICLSVLSTYLSCHKESEKNDEVEKTDHVDSVISGDGIMIHYQVSGKGDKALVFVHCWCCDQTYWRNQIAEFSKKYKVVTLDLGGHGNSGTNRENWTMEAYGADVAAVVNKLNLDNIILIGHSMGGAVIIEAARLLPKKEKALVGVDIYLNLSRNFEEEAIDDFMQAFEDDFKMQTKAYISRIFSPETDSLLVEDISEDISNASPAMGVESLRNALHYDYSKLKDMQIAIRGINSDLYSTDFEVNKGIAYSYDAKIIVGSGHYPHLEKPEDFNRALHEIIMEFWPE